MKKIRYLGIVGLLICNIVINSVSAFAITNNDSLENSNVIDLSNDVVNLSELDSSDQKTFFPEIEDDIIDEKQNSRVIYLADSNGNTILQEENLVVNKNSKMTVQKIEIEDTPIKEDDETEYIMTKDSYSNQNSTFLYDTDSEELTGLVNFDKTDSHSKKASQYGNADYILGQTALNNLSSNAATRGLPDLAVTYAYVTDEIDAIYDYPWPSHAVMPFQVRIDNIGNATASIVHVDVLADGRLIRSDDLGALEIGESWTLDYRFSAEHWGAGVHTITFEVNRNRVITESNYNNNAGSEVDREFVDVVDLKAKEIKLSNSENCKALERVEFTATVSNIGNKDRQLSFDIGVYAYGENVINHIMDDLPAGYKRSYYFSAIFNGHNTEKDTLELRVDQSNKLGKTEVDKENNSVFGTVYVDYADETHNVKWANSRNIQVCILPDAEDFMKVELRLTESDIVNAIKKWNGISDNLRISNVYFSDNASSENDITISTHYDLANPNVYAHAVAYYDDSSFEDHNVHYIEINKAAWSNWDEASKARKTGIITHEVGHLMGLAHSGLTHEEIENNPESVDCIDPAIMYCYRSDDPRSSDTITAHDKANIRYKYGG